MAGGAAKRYAASKRTPTTREYEHASVSGVTRLRFVLVWEILVVGPHEQL
ncbi:hypothetical protein EC9_01510 [Rosistilla ulvae]|uniref:Uncharacterized protein n=1 Tax=Rosistilla ulvae TaxID=1930277 RepID=A0A517LTN9_9BACT|nr:hypothetical protein EC9_01510 [Rosistilla ulvae]